MKSEREFLQFRQHPVFFAVIQFPNVDDLIQHLCDKQPLLLYISLKIFQILHSH